MNFRLEGSFAWELWLRKLRFGPGAGEAGEGLRKKEILWRAGTSNNKFTPRFCFIHDIPEGFHKS